jgi:hypothetical protein
MRHLPPRDALQALNAGRPIEQLLDDRLDEGDRIIRFVRIDKEATGEFAVALFESIDEGSAEMLDIYEFTALDPDLPYGDITEFESAEEAIDFCIADLGAVAGRFVNGGVIQDEYRDRYHSS